MPSLKLQGFMDMINNCGLMDPGHQGNGFTWCNGQQGTNKIYKRLDRILCNGVWFNVFPNAKVMQWTSETSNHKMLGFISQDKEQRRKHGFWFEPMWLTTQEWKDIANKEWQVRHQGSMSLTIIQKLK